MAWLLWTRVLVLVLLAGLVVSLVWMQLTNERER
jgi:hypothetical protein